MIRKPPKNKDISKFKSLLINNISSITKKHIDDIAKAIEEEAAFEESAIISAGISHQAWRDLMNRGPAEKKNYAIQKIAIAKANLEKRLHTAITSPNVSHLHGNLVLKYLEKVSPKHSIRLQEQYKYDVAILFDALYQFEGREINEQFFLDFFDYLRNLDRYNIVANMDDILLRDSYAQKKQRS